MKSNIKKKSRFLINICLIFLIFMSVSIAQSLVSADRTIEKNALAPGSETNVTVIIKNDITQPTSIALKESIPPGWSLTRISDNADTFKTDTNEWIWFAKNSTDVKYKINIPSGTAPGTYVISGTIITSNNTTNVAGDNTIKVSGISGSSSSSGSSGGSTATITATPEKNKINASQTEAQPTVTTVNQTIAAPIETAKAPTSTKSPGFGIIISIGIIATIYVLRRLE